MQTATVDEFFADCPCGKSTVVDRLSSFFAHHSTGDGRLTRPIACVTSGGTTVPLERNCVRFIDNFSAGTRGALSTEQFLEAGYAVIFLTRTGSIQPFTQDLPLTETVPPLQSMLTLNSSSSSIEDISTSDANTSTQQPLTESHASSRSDVDAAAVQYVLREPAAGRVARILSKVRDIQEANLLLTIPFTTIFEYLQSLKAIAAAAQPYGPQVVFYLAAAVSDFYLPWSQLVEHKIQSSDGPLQLTLNKVPKMLSSLRHDWAPSAMIVSFKLETDESILLTKASGALTKYQVHAVVANILHTRKDRVLIVQQQQQQQQQLDSGGSSEPAAAAAPGSSSSSSVDVVEVLRPPSEPHIEKQLVARIVAMHRQFQQQQRQQ